MAHRISYSCSYDERYSFYSLSTYIPDWLHEPLQMALAKYNLTKQQVVIEALAQFLDVRPPHEAIAPEARGEEAAETLGPRLVK